MKKGIIICGVILLCLVIIILVQGAVLFSTNVYIFSEISECEKLEEIKTKDAVITRLENPDSDNSATNLEYNEFYGIEYSSKKLDYTLFAYEFSDPNVAKEYFMNETGIETSLDSNCNGSENIASYRLIVIKNEKAYKITSSSFDKKEVKELLKKVFADKIINDGTLVFD